MSPRPQVLKTSEVQPHRRVFATALRPPARLQISRWAAEKRHLSAATSSDSGRWTNAKTPYLVDIMDALSPDDPCQEVVFMKPSRVGGTEVLNNTVGAYADAIGCPIMVIQPAEADAEEWSKDHFDPMIDLTPSLRAKLNATASVGSRSRGNTILHKRIGSSIVYAVSASTPKSFRRRTARVVVGDEIDGYPDQLAGEGDPCELAKNRADTFTFNKKLFWTSTPTIKGASRIEDKFEASDKRYYMVACPECGHFQRLVFSQLKWVAGVVDKDGFPDAEYCCSTCGTLIPHHQKDRMMSPSAGAHWLATAESLVKGFHISSLYSPWMSWGQLADEFIKKKDDPTKLQVFVNTRLGETWDPQNSDAWDDSSFLHLLEAPAPLPRRVAVLTAGVDVQDDRLVVQVDGWGPHEERWTIERRDLLGDPSTQEVWDELERALLAEYPLELGGIARIRAACIDSGGHHTMAVYDFCRKHKRRSWLAIKGQGDEGRALFPERASRKNKGRVDLWHLGVFAGKEAVHARLRSSLARAQNGQRGGPGYWHFVDGPSLNEVYFGELTNEVCIIKPGSNRSSASSRKREWRIRDRKKRNEALDISVYSMAAMLYLTNRGAVRLDMPMLGLEARQPTLELFTTPPRNLISAQTKSDGSRAEIKIPAEDGPEEPSLPVAAVTHPPPPPPRAPRRKAKVWY